MIDTRALTSIYSTFLVVGMCIILSACGSTTGKQSNQSSASLTNSSVDRFLVGTYTKDGSEGVYLLEIDAKAEKLRNLGAIAGGTNPSYLAISDDQSKLFAATGDKGASVSRFDFNKNSGKFDLSQVLEAQGKGACHIAINPDATMAAISNYGTAEVHVFTIGTQDSSISKKHSFQNVGKSANERRQEKAHMHFSSWDNSGKFLYSVDLGTDEILVFDTSKDNFIPLHRIKLEPGDGPRHLAFHPFLPYVYSINELTNSVSVFEQNTQNGNLIAKQRVNLLQPSEEGKNTSSAIKISDDGRFLYAAVRGVNKLKVFSIGPDAKLSFLQSQSVLGNWPRDFTLSRSGKYVLVANQFSNTITVLKRDVKTGTLSATDMSVEISTPSFVGAYLQ